MAPTVGSTEATECRSIVAHISDTWCQQMKCIPQYSEFCSSGGSTSAVPTISLTVSPTRLPTVIPTAVFTAPTFNPTYIPTVTPTLQPTEMIGIYDFSWVAATPIPPANVNVGIAFSGWADVDTAIADSANINLPVNSQHYISIGGGNDNGAWTLGVLSKLNAAIQDGRLNDYAGICYDIEKGQSGLAAAFSESFAIAKNHGFKVFVTISHSAPYGFSDKVQLMHHFFQDVNIDTISPQLYTSGTEASNDYVYDGVPWSSYDSSIAKIVVSIVSAEYYDDAKDYFATPSRSGIQNGLQIAGFIQWEQNYV